MFRLLTPAQISEGRIVGKARQERAERNGRADTYATADLLANGEIAHIRGCWGEIAVSHALGVPWNKGANVGDPDLDNGTEVRARNPETGPDLFLRPRDKPKGRKPFVLVYVLEDGEAVAVDVIGWIIGNDGMIDAYRFIGGRYPPPGVWYVPPRNLRPISELKLKPDLGLPDHRPSLAGQAIRLGIQWQYIQGLWP